jgi:hypothetical protein
VAGKGRQSWEKRQREKAKRDRQALKREKREDRTEGDETEAGTDGPTESELYERFAKLSQKHAAGEIDDEVFESSRAELFAQLGIETP